MKINIKTFLLRNIGVRQTIFKNTFWLTMGEVVAGFLKLALIIYAARILGAAGYGKFTFALSFVSIISIFADLGLLDFATREFSREKETEREYPAILSLKIILGIGALILAFVGSFFVTSDPLIQRVIWILAFFISISSFLSIFCAFLRSRQKMEYEAGFNIFQIALITILSFFVLFIAPSAENLSYGYMFANLVVLFFILFIFHFRVHSLRLVFDKAIWKKFLRLSWPLSLGFTSSWILVSIDSIMIGYFGEVIQVGWYNAAYKIIYIALILATLISRSFYPVLSKFSREAKEKLQKVWNYQMALMIVLAVPIAMGGLLLSPKIINLFYGSDYKPAILALQFLVFVCAADFLYYPCAAALIISDQQKKNFKLLLTGVVINIILNLVLIPRYGLYGAAIATIISSVIILFLAIDSLRRFTPISPFSLKLFKVLIVSIFASVVMFMVMRQLIIYNFNIFPIIIIGSLIYFFVLLILYIFLSRDNFLFKSISIKK
jgi:O-antigen/teichoic acid export membrane protein